MPVCICITTDDGRFEMAAKVNCEPDKWNPISERFSEGNQEISSLKANPDPDILQKNRSVLN